MSKQTIRNNYRIAYMAAHNGHCAACEEVEVIEAIAEHSFEYRAAGIKDLFVRDTMLMNWRLKEVAEDNNDNNE